MMGGNRFTLRVEGLDTLRQQLTDVAPRVAVNILRGLMYDIGVQLRNTLRARVQVNTGLLRRSIAVKRSKMSGNVIGAEVYTRMGKSAVNAGWYWHFIEYGTTHSPAEPFVGPSLEEMEKILPARLDDLFTRRYIATLEREAKRAAK